MSIFGLCSFVLKLLGSTVTVTVPLSVDPAFSLLPLRPLYLHGLQASVHESIPSSNLGFKMLVKMGWKGDSGLGKKEQGV